MPAWAGDLMILDLHTALRTALVPAESLGAQTGVRHFSAAQSARVWRRGGARGHGHGNAGDCHQLGCPADHLDNTCGILVDPTSRDGFVAGLSDALQVLAKQPDLRVAMGGVGRQMVVDHFDWEVKVGHIGGLSAACWGTALSFI